MKPKPPVKIEMAKTAKTGILNRFEIHNAKVIHIQINMIARRIKITSRKVSVRFILIEIEMLIFMFLLQET